mmetsp:Transcript_7941/g.33405  ORF Transcript_7941/g.33405 Transcript_7941/m.33405 type:complete len:303 (-) Transcript_7941:7-915(-)
MSSAWGTTAGMASAAAARPLPSSAGAERAFSSSWLVSASWYFVRLPSTPVSSTCSPLTSFARSSCALPGSALRYSRWARPNSACISVIICRGSACGAALTISSTMPMRRTRSSSSAGARSARNAWCARRVRSAHQGARKRPGAALSARGSSRRRACSSAGSARVDVVCTRSPPSTHSASAHSFGSSTSSPRAATSAAGRSGPVQLSCTNSCRQAAPSSSSGSCSSAAAGTCGGASWPSSARAAGACRASNKRASIRQLAASRRPCGSSSGSRAASYSSSASCSRCMTASSILVVCSTGRQHT